MNTISEYLKQYLTFNQDVSVGMLGFFSAQPTGAAIHPVIHEFHPPKALLCFEEDASCETSPLFVQFVAQNAAVSLNDANNSIDEFRSHIWSELKEKTCCFIEGFGTFKRMPNHSTEFEQDETLQLNALAFGLPSFSLLSDSTTQTLETDDIQVSEERIVLPKMEIPSHEVVEKAETVQEVEVQTQPDVIQEEHVSEERIVLPKMEIPSHEVVEKAETVQEVEVQTQPDVIQEEHISEEARQSQPVQPKTRKRKTSVVWMVLLFVFVAGAIALYSTGYWEVLYGKAKHMVGIDKKTDVAEANMPIVESTDDEQVVVSDEKQESIQQLEEDKKEEVQVEAPSQQQVASTSQHKYFIVADCFRDLQLAEKRAKDLQSQGYGSTVAGQTKQGLHIVTYGGYSDRAEAESMLKDIQKNVQKDSWLYSK